MNRRMDGKTEKKIREGVLFAMSNARGNESVESSFLSV